MFRPLLLITLATFAAMPLEAQLLRPHLSDRTVGFALAGAAVGAIAAVATAEKCTDQDWVCFGPEIQAVMGAGVGFLAGALVGIVIDAIDGPDTRRVKFRVTPTSASVRLSVPLPHLGTER